MNLPLYDLSQGFTPPCRRLVDPKFTFGHFQSSRAYVYTIAFLDAVLRAVPGTLLSSAPPPTPSAQLVMHVLDAVSVEIEAVQPAPKGPRFGNLAFRTLIDRLAARAEALHAPFFDATTDLAALSPAARAAAVEEVSPYFLCGWGHRRRLDYGTGHELSFLQWLTCLARLGVIHTRADFASVGLHVLPRYWQLCRLIQRKYTLEPAGSRGMWGLDDFNYLPYVVGAAQAEGMEDIISPRMLTDRPTARAEARDWIIADAVFDAMEARVAPIVESAPILYDLLTAKDQSWTKFRRAVAVQWVSEVMLRFTAAQHFLFGRILPFVDDDLLSARARKALAEAQARGLTAPGALTGVGIGAPDGADFVTV